ncbi:hypothetical protein GGTG_14361 [Gaeumannomyces tritici R3-111a-1]|uniref:Uncharacterized protein n=1 Tax=Gaeumannomyces tritici (strain R3-111a-1) TaxID=644352 RepID=J3PLA5_GAET3|nr:hypothetical protein GGTG_14361 [Gaeumannomyces tritici R3-111a-1]EJT68060.1 hypothetical protein GGTG_14361 [Gaeumannomyces tritici R3-111a-1]
MANAGPSDRRSSSPPDGTYQQGDDDDEHDEAGRAPAEPADWDLDTDDVRSISSSDLTWPFTCTAPLYSGGAADSRGPGRGRR